MSRVEWNLPGERRFETGVDRGVLYPLVGSGVPWNGLVSISEDTSGGDVEALYFDGVKYADVVANEDFSVTLEAYSSPPEFAASDGVKMLVPGLFVTQQPRKSFGLSYRTLIGNDLQGEEYGYKLHLVYNCTAKPTGKSNQTLSNGSAPSTRSWEIDTVPPPAGTFRPVAHVVLDSTLIDPYLMQEVETALYGREASTGLASRDAYLPTVSELVLILGNTISATIEATI